jgi:leader peptidase (prepilin peptidase)/N-methyltransferase
MTWYVVFSVLAFVWGACIGSFLNVCIYRIPLDLSVVKPRSFCPACKRPIPWYLNVPLLSYVLLGGRCRWCRTRITPRYVLVELLVAVLFLLVWLKFEFPGVSTALGLAPVSDWKIVPVYWLMVSGLVLGTFVDFEHMIIPDRVTLGGIAAGFVLSAVVPSLHGETGVLRSLIQSAIGIAAGWGLLWATGVLGKMLFRKEAMGFGDVKLLGAIGAFLGWKAVLSTVVLSSLVGSIVGITLVATKCKKMQSRIPYGPYLALAALIWMLWGPSIWQWYMNLLVPGGFQTE